MLRIMLFAALALVPTASYAVSPEAPPMPFAAEIVMPEGPFKTGDTINIDVKFKNISEKPAKVDGYAPYILFPVIRDAESGDVMNVYTPPIDIVSEPKSVTVAPGENFTLASNKIKIVADNKAEAEVKALEPYNNSLASMPAGTYVINYVLWLGTVNGAESAPVDASSKSFQIQ